jgi:hypothetical protein
MCSGKRILSATAKGRNNKIKMLHNCKKASRKSNRRKKYCGRRQKYCGWNRRAWVLAPEIRYVGKQLYRDSYILILTNLHRN